MACVLTIRTSEERALSAERARAIADASVERVKGWPQPAAKRREAPLTRGTAHEADEGPLPGECRAAAYADGAIVLTRAVSATLYGARRRQPEQSPITKRVG